MILRSDCRQTLILFSTSDSPPTSPSTIVTCIILPASRICPREQNEKHQENYWKTRTISATVSPNVPGPLPPFRLQTDPGVACQMLTSPQAMWLQDLRE